jgi:hypothetical protein
MVIAVRHDRAFRNPREIRDKLLISHGKLHL